MWGPLPERTGILFGSYNIDDVPGLKFKQYFN